MVHNPGGDWHPGRGDNPSYNPSKMKETWVPRAVEECRFVNSHRQERRNELSLADGPALTQLCEAFRAVEKDEIIAA